MNLNGLETGFDNFEPGARLFLADRALYRRKGARLVSAQTELS